MDKKQCDICGTTLSLYNKGKRCFTHTEGNAVIERTPVTNCTSYKARTEFADQPMDPVDEDDHLGLPIPGTESFDNMAFDKQVTGIVNKDGELELFDEPLTLDDIRED
jgi:hypothetical protein